MIKCVSTVFSGSWDTISVESGPVLVTTLASVHAPATHYNHINTGTRILCIFELCHGAELLLQPAEEAEAALLRVQELAPDQVTRL